MKKPNTRTICQVGVIAALYVALTTLNPVSWGTVQFRVATMVCVLPFLDKKYSPAVLLGVSLANAFSPLGVIDVAFGLGTHAAAHGLLVFGPGKRLPIFAKIVTLSLMVALSIGAELTMVYHIPYVMNVASLFLSTFVLLMAGNVIFAPMKRRGIL